jgi:hypothetical protein
VTNTLAYQSTKLITAVKSFVIQAPEAYNIKLLMALINSALGITVTNILAHHIMVAMTLSIKTLSIMTFSISKLSIKGLFVTLRITILCHCAVYNYAKCWFYLLLC